MINNLIINEHAPAKINLGLSIAGKRPDGYHDIISVFQTVNLIDTLRLSTGSEKRLVCNNRDIPDGPENLVLQAEKLFFELHDISENIQYTLDKRIPVGAGLAGGSSDAAAALRGLRSYYGLDISDNKLKDMAAELGSDIPFLINGGTAVVSGRGEIIREIEWPFDFTYVIVYPGFGVSTAWAYGNLDLAECGSEAYRAVTDQLIGGDLGADDLLQALSNDFEPTVFKEYPVLAEIKKRLLEYGADASFLTGSGSSVLGVFGNEQDAHRCEKILKSDYADVFTVKTYS